MKGAKLPLYFLYLLTYFSFYRLIACMTIGKRANFSVDWAICAPKNISTSTPKKLLISSDQIACYEPTEIVYIPDNNLVRNCFAGLNPPNGKNLDFVHFVALEGIYYIFSFNKYQNFLSVSGCWLLNEKFSDCHTPEKNWNGRSPLQECYASAQRVCVFQWWDGRPEFPLLEQLTQLKKVKSDTLMLSYYANLKQSSILA